MSRKHFELEPETAAWIKTGAQGAFMVGGLLLYVGPIMHGQMNIPAMMRWWGYAEAVAPIVGAWLVGALMAVLVVLVTARSGRVMTKALTRSWHYRRQWAQSMVRAGLADKVGSQVVAPRIRQVVSIPGGELVTVRMLAHHEPQDWSDASPALARMFGASSVRIRTDDQIDRGRYHDQIGLAFTYGPGGGPEMLALPPGRSHQPLPGDQLLAGMMPGPYQQPHTQRLTALALQIGGGWIQKQDGTYRFRFGIRMRWCVQWPIAAYA